MRPRDGCVVPVLTLFSRFCVRYDCRCLADKGIYLIITNRPAHYVSAREVLSRHHQLTTFSITYRFLATDVPDWANLALRRPVLHLYVDRRQWSVKHTACTAMSCRYVSPYHQPCPRLGLDDNAASQRLST